MISLQPVRVKTGKDDEDGLLVLVDGSLVALLVQLSGEEQGELIGSWFLEVGFGPYATTQPPVFPSLVEAQAWIEQHVQR